VRMKSSWSLRNISVRNTLYTGASVTAGPNVSTTYPLGSFKEDYGFTTPVAPDYLDEHNGRFCITPEYPNGIYCYFATINSNWNSAYPYLVGPTYYGTKVAAKVTSITETVISYTTSTTGVKENEVNKINVNVFPNPASDLIAIQIKDLVKENCSVELYDVTGKLVDKTTLYQGSTIVYFDTKKLYNGIYFVKMRIGNQEINRKIVIEK